MLAASSLKAALDRARRRGIVAHCRGWLETLARKKEIHVTSTKGAVRAGMANSVNATFSAA